MSVPRLLLAAMIVLDFAATTATAGDAVLENRHVRIALDPAQGCATKEIRDLVGGRTLLAGNGTSLWEIVWRTPDERDLHLKATEASRCQAQLKQAPGKRSLHLQWSELKLAAGAARVEAVGTLADDSPLSHWTLRVEWTDKTLCLHHLDFPKLGGIARGGPEDVLAIPVYWGRECRDPIAKLPRYSAGYPVSGSMQFWSFASGGSVLYLATYDSDCWLKRYGWFAESTTGRAELRATHLAPEPTPQPGRYEIPYAIAVGAFPGDWQDAAAEYRRWALAQPWCREGPLSTRTTISDRFRRTALWLKYYGEPGKVLGEVADHGQFLRVPLGVHYYRYPISEFDDNYPEMLPAKEGFLEAVRDMQRLGAAVIPYTQGSIWDVDTQSWRREQGQAAAVKQEGGQFIPWGILPNIFAWMCPATRLWQEKVFDFTSKLVWDYNLDGVYLDVLSAGSAMPCCDPQHGHALHGGNSWGQGNRKLMDDLRRRIRARKPQALFTTEEICETYIDRFDGFLTLDMSRGGNTAVLRLLPLFTAVYHDYAIQYGSDCALSSPTDVFCGMLAEHFAWGALPTLSEMKPPRIADRPESAAYLREVVRCYDGPGRKHLQLGAWLRAPRLDAPTAPVGPFGRPPMTIAAPVVRHSLWRSPTGELGLLLTNWTSAPQRVELALRPADYGLAGPWYAHTLWPAGSDRPERGGERWKAALTLPPRSVRLIEFSPSLQPPSPSRERGRGEGADDSLERFLFLRRTKDGFPTTRVPPGSHWTAPGARVAVAANGALTVEELESGNDFVLLERLSKPPAPAPSLRIKLPPHSRAVPYETLDAQLVLSLPDRRAAAWENLRVELAANRRREMAGLKLLDGPTCGRVPAEALSVTVGRCRLKILDRDLAEHTVTIRARVDLVQDGQRRTLDAATVIPVDVPVLADLTPRNQTFVAGRTAEATLRVRNVMRQPVSVSLHCSLPSGWTLNPPGGVQAVLPATGDLPSSTLLRVGLATPPTAKMGNTDVPLRLTYSGHPESEIVCLLPCEVLPNLKPLQVDSAVAAAPTKPPRIRHDGRAAVYVKQGETVRLSLTARPVTPIGSAAKYRVLDPDLRPGLTGQVVKGRAGELVWTARQTGVYFVELQFSLESGSLVAPGRPLFWEASKSQPYRVLAENPPLWLYVPRGAKRFTLAVQCGGEGEPAAVQLTAPDGRTVVQAEGALLNRRFEAPVSPADCGRAWKLVVKPREDVVFYLEGDALPYLSADPRHLLVPEGETAP